LQCEIAGALRRPPQALLFRNPGGGAQLDENRNDDHRPEPIDHAAKAFDEAGGNGAA
jgi:hypothetical protein